MPPHSGDQVAVWWPTYRSWFTGRVVDLQKKKGVRIQWDSDGKESWHLLPDVDRSTPIPRPPPHLAGKYLWYTIDVMPTPEGVGTLEAADGTREEHPSMLKTSGREEEERGGCNTAPIGGGGFDPDALTDEQVERVLNAYRRRQAQHDGAPGTSSRPAFDDARGTQLLRMLHGLQEEVRGLQEAQNNVRNQAVVAVRNELAMPDGDTSRRLRDAARTADTSRPAYKDAAPAVSDARLKKLMKESKKRACSNLGRACGCAGHARAGKLVPGHMLPQYLVEQLRTPGTPEGADFFGLFNGLTLPPVNNLRQRLVCRACHAQHYGNRSGSLLLGQGSYIQCECCHEVRSAGYKGMDNAATCRSCVYPLSEADDLDAFLPRWWEPYAIALRERGIATRIMIHGLALPAPYDSVDVLVLGEDPVTHEVIVAIAVEIDTDQHPGEKWDTDKHRTKVTIRQLRAAYPKALNCGVVHFNVRDGGGQETKKAAHQAKKKRARDQCAADGIDEGVRGAADDEGPEPGARRAGPGRPRKNKNADAPASTSKRDCPDATSIPASTRWMILGAWLHWAFFHRRGQQPAHLSRVPQHFALYLFYDADNGARIVWPHGDQPGSTGVCGCTSRAPRSAGPGACDWGFAVGLSQIRSTMLRGETALQPGSLAADHEVFGQHLGPNARPPGLGDAGLW